LSTSDTYSVTIECVFSYNLDLFISNRNRLTASVHKITFYLRAWLKFGKWLYEEENKIYWYFWGIY